MNIFDLFSNKQKLDKKISFSDLPTLNFPHVRGKTGNDFLGLMTKMVSDVFYTAQKI